MNAAISKVKVINLTSYGDSTSFKNATKVGTKKRKY